MDDYFFYTDQNKNTRAILNGRVSDIIKTSRDISNDWLSREVEKNIAIKDKLKEQKDKQRGK